MSGFRAGTVVAVATPTFEQVEARLTRPVLASSLIDLFLDENVVAIDGLERCEQRCAAIMPSGERHR